MTPVLIVRRLVTRATCVVCSLAPTTAAQMPSGSGETEDLKVRKLHVEKTLPICHSPKRTPKIEIAIADSKEEAVSQDAQAQEQHEHNVYSDGSGIDGQVGGAAVLQRRGRTIRELGYHLGPMTQHTVYEGELVGMILAMELLRQEPQVHSASLALDNQAAIRACVSSRAAPSHYLVDIFRSSLHEALAQHKFGTLRVRWTPGHEGIPGNEQADEAAKLAAKGKQ